MSTLLNGKGYFSLSDSDSNIGSFFSINDICEILEINDESKLGFSSALEKMGLIKNGFVDEKDLYPKWKVLKTQFSTKPPLHYTSFDEYVLLAIFRRTFPDAQIEQQVNIGKKYIDFKITYNGVTKYIEFDGPTHFVSEKKDGMEDPLVRIHEIQEKTNCELVRWPFWIQRCSCNAKIIFDRSLAGKGALWSSKKYFGDFSVPSSTIKVLTQRFNAEKSNGIGYFYEVDSLRNKPEHPIIKKILKDPSRIKTLIPIDAKDSKYWVPQALWRFLE